MHIVHLNERGAAAFGTDAPGKYLLTDANTGEALALGYATEAHHYPCSPPATSDHNQLIIRAGGYGDLLMLSRILQHLQIVQHRGITVATFSKYAPMLRDNQCETIRYPVPLETTQQFSHIISLEETIEANPNTHAVDAYCAAFHLDPELFRQAPLYTVTDEEYRIALDRFPRCPGTRRLALQFQASAACRTWPQSQQINFIQRAIKDGWRVFLFGSPGSWAGDSNMHLVNLSQQNPSISFTESAAILKTCDAAVVPDSALCHMAAALGIPTIALYGPFHWKTRTRDYMSVRAIQGHARCSPCSHHVRGGVQFPTSETCAQLGYCTAMANITPERVLNSLNRLTSILNQLLNP